MEAKQEERLKAFDRMTDIDEQLKDKAAERLGYSETIKNLRNNHSEESKKLRLEAYEHLQTAGYAMRELIEEKNALKETLKRGDNHDNGN